ncbi:MAG: glycosyltransferase [Treponema sp.]|uniref:glycosyltransferase n=1 Tax=Treponema sp. TaxID=166 RepID=UPI00298D60B7|nr:glycosyltransferase [Treponema sp.]MCQ2601577.1 glycosyltransferase [Treponema sp.]
MEKKKILFINNNFQYSDGTVRALIGMVNNMDLNKFDITVKGLFYFHKELVKEVKPEIKVEPCFGFYFRGFKRIVKLLPAKFWYKKFVKDDYDIEVAYQCDLPTLMVGASTNEKAVHIEWMHGYENYPKQYAKADRVVCVSRHNEERCRKECNGNVNVTHLYNLVDDSIVTNKSSLDVPSELNFSNKRKPLFVTVGRLSPEKGYVRLVEIMKDLSDEGFDFSLVIVGGGAEESSIRKAISETHMEERIFLTGKQNNPYNIVSQADCFICSSFSEGYSTACTEAALLGIPIITTCVAGGKEIIETCECGLLTELDDESLKAGIRTVLKNPEFLSQWKETLNTTKEKFSLKSRVKEMNDFFDEVYELSEGKK